MAESLRRYEKKNINVVSHSDGLLGNSAILKMRHVGNLRHFRNTSDFEARIGIALR